MQSREAKKNEIRKVVELIAGYIKFDELKVNMCFDNKIALHAQIETNEIILNLFHYDKEHKRNSGEVISKNNDRLARRLRHEINGYHNSYIDLDLMSDLAS